MEETKNRVINFYYCSDIVYSAPDLKDGTTVWAEARKTKMGKYYLRVYLQEGFFQFFKKKSRVLKLVFQYFTVKEPTIRPMFSTKGS